MASVNGIVASIVAADTAPEISPNVTTVFFIELKSPLGESSFHIPKCSGGRGRCRHPFGGFCLGGRKIVLSGGADPSRDQPGGLAELHGLGAPLGAELIKQAARMGLDRVFADK